ncbi:porin family protein [Parabacteroides sp. PF5-6]|uniref:porin family protein n=1 Tax=Parabacteroides sp. PF5-6 TaxID=1742403 RepID=UPI002405C127|nr:porin family protein [Parabacteroides sp. PF5-6]MDF9829055.1 opacity protein-like surface antigen [Parabacteroides sp. PF5-6]
MKEKERDNIDDLFQSKLSEWEIDVMPQDWERIADRLPRATSIPFYRKATYWAAAAVAALLMVMSGIYFFEQQPVGEAIVQEIERHTEALKPPVYTAPSVTTEQPVIAKAMQAAPIHKKKEELPLKEREDEEVDQPYQAVEDEQPISVTAGDDEMPEQAAVTKSNAGQAEVTPTNTVSSEKAKPRRWGFGMGAGGVSVGASNVVPSYLVSTMGLRGEDLLLMNAPSGGRALPKTDVHHNKPLSFGVGISYYLNSRFALQSGVAYTYLSSDWQTNDEYKVKTTQKLHFIGIPLGVTYKIAEWQRFNLYAYAGVQMDLNVAGRQKGELVRDALISDVVIDSEVRSVREKKVLLSANAKVGVSYPVLRFLSAYAEAGAGYYFDNGSALFDKMSTMPTIYSEKPLNLTLQAGFRLGF